MKTIEKRAIELAFEEGFIKIPKRELNDLNRNETYLFWMLVDSYMYLSSVDKVVDNKFFIPPSLIEDRLKLSKVTVIKTLNSLCEKGYIKIDKGGVSNRRWYSIQWEKLLECFETEKNVPKIVPFQRDVFVGEIF